MERPKNSSQEHLRSKPNLGRISEALSKVTRHLFAVPNDRLIESTPRSHWVGRTTWYIPGMSANIPNSLPESMEITDLSPLEMRAALDICLIGPSMIPDNLWGEIQSFDDEDVFPAARALNKKLDEEEERGRLNQS